jgi:RNA polymerase sigma-B factor
LVQQRCQTHPTRRAELVVLRLRYVDELTQGEIGAQIWVSQMQVSRILRGIVDRLRAELLDDDVRQSHRSAA